MSILGFEKAFRAKIVITGTTIISFSSDWVDETLIALVTVMNLVVFIKRRLLNATLLVTFKILHTSLYLIVKLY